MNEGKKDAYEVGIPLDDLPPEEPSTDKEIDEALPDNASETSDDSSGLPDLFAPEELAEVGLTTELADFVEDENEDEDSQPHAIEPSAAVESPAEIVEQDASATVPPAPNSADPADEGVASDPDIENSIPPEVASRAAEDENAAAMDAALSGADEDDTDLYAAEDSGDSEPAVDDGILNQDLLVGRLESLSLQIEELQREFEGKLKYDAHKDEIIDRLHSELQEYKQNIIKKYVLSIVMDVVKVADDIRKWMSYFRSLEVSQRDPRKLFRYLEAIPSDLEDVFYWHGVKPFANQGGPFDPTRQRTIKKVPTDDPALDKKIAQSIRPGYEWETKVIRQEMVAVYVYQEAQESKNMGMIDE